MRILVFGDSISEGFWDYENGGWVNMLKTHYWKYNSYENMVFNFGVSAYTSTDILNYFDTSVKMVSKRKPGKEKETTIIFAIGINDSSINRKTNLEQVDIKLFEKNINNLLSKCKNNELIKNIIFVGNINVDEKVINDGNIEDNEFYYYNDNIKKYNNLLKEIADFNNHKFIDIFGLMNNEDLDDGLHPNNKGHEKIFNKIKADL